MLRFATSLKSINNNSNIVRPRFITNIYHNNMSTSTTSTAAATSGAKTEAGGVSKTVTKSVYANEVSEGVGARVRRSIGSRELRNMTPFLLLDHFRAGKGAAFPDHPHRGQTTVTYMMKGRSDHEDSMGNRGTLEPGDVQWMTAGKGILHAEIPHWDEQNPPEGMQLWIDLPQDEKFVEPSYQERKAKDIPVVKPEEGVQITVISGDSHGVKGFVRPVGGCWYFDVRLSQPGKAVHQPLPKGWTSFIYVLTGEVQVGDEPLPHAKHNLLVLSRDEDGVTITRPAKSSSADANEEARFVLVAGRPLDQRVVQYGPFVVNTAQQVQDAFEDFQMGKNGFESAVGWKSEIGKDFR